MAIIARCRKPPLSWWAYSSTRFRPPHAHQPQQLDGRAGPFGLILRRKPNRLADLVTGGVHRAEQGHRLLEDEPDPTTIDRPHLGAISLEFHQIDRGLTVSLHLLASYGLLSSTHSR